MRAGFEAKIVLAKKLPITLKPAEAFPFSAANYANASDRYLEYGNVVTGPFTSGTLATRIINGRKFADLEKSFTQSVPYSDRLDNIWWTFGGLQGLGIATPNDAIAPDGSSTACRLTTDVPAGIVYCRKHSEQVVGVNGLLSAYLKRGTQGAIFGLRYSSVGSSNLDITTPIEWGRYQIRCVATDGYLVLYQCWGGDLGTGQTPGDNHLLWGVQLEFGEYYAHRPVPNNSGASVIVAKDELYWLEADIPAWLRTGFKVQLIPQYSSVQLAVDGGHKFIACYPTTIEDINVYMDGADLKIKLDGSVSGPLAETAPLTFTARQPLELEVQFDNGANSVLTIDDVQTTGVSCAVADGPLYWGMDASALLHWDYLISEPEPI